MLLMRHGEGETRHHGAQSRARSAPAGGDEGSRMSQDEGMLASAEGEDRWRKGFRVDVRPLRDVEDFFEQVVLAGGGV